MPSDPTLTEDERKKDLSVKLKLMSASQEERLVESRAQSLGVPYINLVTFPIDAEVLQMIPKSQAANAGAVLFYRQGKDVRMGAISLMAEGVAEMREYVERTVGSKPEVYLISARSLAATLARYRRESTFEVEQEGELTVAAQAASDAQKTIESLEELGKQITTLKPTEILQSIVTGAVQMDASDVHIEPREKDARLRFRIDGVLQDITTFARDGWSLMLSRVKVLSRLKLNIHDTPQDGSFVLRLPNEDIYDIRVSVLPGGFGETVVMRLLSRKSQVVKISDLGMKERDFELMKKELNKVNGLILVTGPTGSGKTTSLASFIQEVNSPDIKVITLEDPIEYHLTGVQQTQVDASAGFTFAKGLRSILRQDPDMILVGEMRDAETAETAIHAALTGHLVFTTLHTNNAAGAIPRLLNMGIKPHALAPAVNVVIAQRLVRVLCKKCTKKYTPTLQEIEKIEAAMQGVSVEVFDPKVLRTKGFQLYSAHGCDACVGGYKGRLGVFEIFAATQKIKELIISGADEFTIQDVALAQGMTTISQDGYLKVLDGITTIEEVERISSD